MKLSGSPSVRCASITVAGPNTEAPGGWTVVVAEALLSEGLGSEVGLDADAVLMMVPVWVGVTTTSTEVWLPLERLPKLHVTVAVPVHVGDPGVTETSVVFAGNGSVSVTFAACCGP